MRDVQVSGFGLVRVEPFSVAEDPENSFVAVRLPGLVRSQGYGTWEIVFDEDEAAQFALALLTEVHGP